MIVYVWIKGLGRLRNQLATSKNPRNGLHEKGYLLNDERPRHTVYCVLVSLAYGSIGFWLNVQRN